ncbi:hypothetical protein COU96_02430, partial [Candidatus Shapirobacteria bacterium CG10_big_fil_rev_8_21_14_0_10_38_14]
MLKKIVGIFVILIVFGVLVKPALAQEEARLPDGQAKLYFFWSKGCPHCAQEEIFLDVLEKKYDIEVKRYEITSNRDNARLLKEINSQLSIDISGVPFTAVGKYHFIGYLNDETTGREIEKAVRCALETHCPDLVGNVINNSKKSSESEEGKAIPETISLPLLGKIKTKNFSLPLFTFVVALADGFNPCAMWVLLFLISLLLGMRDKKKMWLLGTTFIVASGLIYFLFMSAWLNLFLFLGFVLWVRILIGL